MMFGHEFLESNLVFNLRHKFKTQYSAALAQFNVKVHMLFPVSAIITHFRAFHKLRQWSHRTSTRFSLSFS
jgi:hypothetical protein